MSTENEISQGDELKRKDTVRAIRVLEVKLARRKPHCLPAGHQLCGHFCELKLHRLEHKIFGRGGKARTR